MQLYFRLIILLVKSFFLKKETIFDKLEVPFTVLPSDLDINRHMNNSRYLAIMDLGRIDFMTRTGILMKALKVRWAPVVANIDISFYKSLKPWQSYTLTTEMDTYDEKYFYMKQKFFRNETLYAEAKVKGLFLNKDGKLSPEEVIEQTDYNLETARAKLKAK